MPILIDKTNKKKNKYYPKNAALVMHEFEAGELHTGKSDTTVTQRKQATAIALSEAKNLKK